jgi:hypothetical protein
MKNVLHTKGRLPRFCVHSYNYYREKLVAQMMLLFYSIIVVNFKTRFHLCMYKWLWISRQSRNNVWLKPNNFAYTGNRIRTERRQPSHVNLNSIEPAGTIPSRPHKKGCVANLDKSDYMTWVYGRYERIKYVSSDQSHQDNMKISTLLNLFADKTITK